jgi:hypothetical protein
MSFKNVGQIAVLGGSSVRVALSFGNGLDEGPQWFMANSDSSISNLEVGAFAKVKSYDRPSEQVSVSYQGTVTNHGANEVFSIEGGGNT